MGPIAQILDIILQAISWIIIIQAILSWLVAFNVLGNRSDAIGQIYYALDKLTEPIYRPFRKIMPDFGALDLTPMVVLLTIIIVQRVLLPMIPF